MIRFLSWDRDRPVWDTKSDEVTGSPNLIDRGNPVLIVEPFGNVIDTGHSIPTPRIRRHFYDVSVHAANEGSDIGARREEESGPESERGLAEESRPTFPTHPAAKRQIAGTDEPQHLRSGQLDSEDVALKIEGWSRE
jgi:hypothetical protein